MKLACITYVHNESDMIQQFLAHYRAQEVDHFYIFDNYSTDSTPGILKNEPDVTYYLAGRPDQLDDILKLETIELCRHAISSEYAYCVTVDGDEFVYNSSNTIKGFCEDAPKPLYLCAGYNMIQHPTDEPYLHERSLLSQRQHGVRDAVYDKPVVSKTTANVKWGAGMHCAELDGRFFEADYDFLLLHYTAFDYDVAMRHRMRQIERTGEVNQSRGHGSWKKPLDEKYVADWFAAYSIHPQARRVI